MHFPLAIKDNTKNSRLTQLVHQNLKQQSSDGALMPWQKTQLGGESPGKPLAPFGVALGTCCPGGWRRPWAHSAARSWAAESERTSGRRSTPRRPSPPLPSSAVHVPAPGREQRRGPAWTSAPRPGHQRGGVAGPAPKG